MNNSDKNANIRDYATIGELIVMTNLESANTQFFAEDIAQSERLKN